jgi:hypothetical protein
METIEIRDTRRKQMFQVDDEYLNGYARLCGISATGVYVSLCRHVNKSQKCWPSVELIGKELSINERTVRRAIKSLEEWNIIKADRQKDEKTKRWKVTIYTLTDKSAWKPKPPDTVTAGATGQLRHDPPDFNDTKPPDTSTLEGLTQEEGHTHKRRIATETVADTDEGQKINLIMEKFQMHLNPTINYGNKTQRKAIQDLLAIMGQEKLIRTIEYVESIKHEQFAPTITTPYQLKEKLAQLTAYYQKSLLPKKGMIQSL